MIRDLIQDLPKHEQTNIKAQEIARIKGIPKTKRIGFDIEVIDIKAIDNGVEVLARAWDEQGQIGFGKDGTVEIERFRIINPPILVPDGTKKQIQLRNQIIEVDNYKEDLQEALLQILEHTIKVKKQKFDSSKIELGKIGSTTLTAFPSANGVIFNDPAGAESWATMHDAADGTSVALTSTANTMARIAMTATTDTYDILARSGYTYDTSSIGTDTIDSAIKSLRGTSVANTYTGTPTMKIVICAFTPADAATYVTGDYDQFGTTAFSTGIAAASWSTTGYNDFTLNASGVTNINKTGNTVFGARELEYDLPNTTPTWGSGEDVEFVGNYVDNAGTTADPKLVVEHTAAAGGGTSVNNLLLLKV